MKTYLEPSEIGLLQNATSNMRDRLLIRVLFHLGCRISEALALCVEDIDFERSTITIQHLKVRLKLSCADCGVRLSRSHTFCPGCGIRVEGAQAEQQERRRQRVLPIDGDTLDMLSEYIERGGPVTRNGRREVFGISRHRSWQIVTKCAEAAQLPKVVNAETGKIHNVSPHRLRDAFAVRAVKMDDSGDGLRLLQQHLGHASFNTTARYRKISGDEHKEWYQRLWESEQRDYSESV